MSKQWIWSLGLAITAISAAGACATDDGDDTGDDVACETGHCDSLPFPEQLKGREDPIAKFLRTLSEKDIIDKDGVFQPDKASEISPTNDPMFYAKLLDGVASVQGCDPNSLIQYALSDDLVNGDAYPRLISTLCSSNPDLVTNAFVATTGSPAESGDLALDDLEMFAWDATKTKYFFYAAKPAGEGKLKFEVDPQRCGECHETHKDVDPVAMPRLPIMNELTKPWTHWNAGEGSTSESFIVPDMVVGKENWEKWGNKRVAAASRFEKVIRDANALRVAPTRNKQLFRPAKIDEAMGLIRPLFCDEQTNYVSELGTGEISTDAVVAGGIKGAFRTIQATWPFGWFNNDNIQLPPTGADKQLFVMPVRGMADVTFEAQLASVLTPAQILAVRALDWKHPTFSTMRCNMWRDAWAEFATKPPTITGRNRDAVKVAYDAIMKKAGMSTRNLGSSKFVVLESATEEAVKGLKDAVAAGNIPTECSATQTFCEVDVNGFGQILDAYVTALESDPAKRDELLAERDRRVCATQQRVDPAGAHSVHGSGKRVPNEPSFLRVLDGKPVSTIPTTCN